MANNTATNSITEAVNFVLHIIDNYVESSIEEYFHNLTLLKVFDLLEASLVK